MPANPDITQLLTLLIGLYICAASIGIALHPEAINKMISEISENVTLSYLIGLFAFTIGAVIVVIHNRWTGLQEGFISFIGWAAMVEGLLFLALRRQMAAWLSHWKFSRGFTSMFCMMWIAVGMVMVLFGLDAL